MKPNQVGGTALAALMGASLAVLGLNAGCSSKSPEAGLGDAQAGAPTTGATGSEAPGPSDADVHEARIKALLARVKGGTEVLSTSRTLPIIEVAIDCDAQVGTFTARYRLAILNGDAPLPSFALDVPANAVARPTGPSLVLVAARVAGVPATIGGTATRWEVPVDLAPGERVEVELELKGTLARPAVDAGVQVGNAAGSPPGDPEGIGALLGQLEGVPELSRLVPVVPVVDLAAVGGADLDVIAGLPRPAGRGAVWELSVTARPEGEVDAVGARVGTDRDAGQTTHRFIARAPEIAAVVTRGLAATTSLVAEVPVTVRTSPERAGAAQELMADVRRALEVLDGRWGVGGPAALSVIAVDGLEQVATAPGIVVVPGRLLDAPAYAAGVAPKLSLSTLFRDLAEHHPAAREALSFAVAIAIAEGWWWGVGEGAAADNLLRQGLSRQAALAVVAGKGGDKAARRAIELGLRLPLQLALERGVKDVVLATLVAQAGGADSELVALKAGLFVETLARHLGEAQMALLTKKLLAAERPSSVAAIRAEVIALSARPDETRELLARWLDRAELQQDLGPLRPEVLLEYLVADGAVGSMTSLLMGQMGADRLGGRTLELLGEGQALDAGLALSLLGELVAEDADPTTKKWLTLGSQLLGGAGDQRKAVDGLVDELGEELGIPESERSRMKQLSTLLLHALREGSDAPTVEPPAPPSP